MAVEASSNPSAVHTVALLLIVGTVLTLPWMLPQAISEEDAEEEEEEEGTLPSILGPLLMMMLPILLLVLVRWSASDQAARLAPQNADAATIHRVTGSSPGILILIIIVLGMVSFHSSLQ